MNYSSIKSSDGGTAPHNMDTPQPLQGPLGSTAEAAAPNRSGPSGGAKQFGDGGSMCKTSGSVPKHKSI